MESKLIGSPTVTLRPILTVATQADFAEALRLRRLEMGLTQMQLDHVAGFHDGYTAHLERPFSRTGKKSFKLTPMAGIWLEALGLEIALVPRSYTTSAVSEAANQNTMTDMGALLHPCPAIQSLSI